MEKVLSEIPRTLELLMDALAQQSATISTPSINQYRSELVQMINGAVKLTTNINEQTQRLVTVSEQTSKHLAAIEDHFGPALRNKPTEPQPQQNIYRI
jgi:hypothetical protein